MFGLFKKMVLIGALASGFAKLVEDVCGEDVFTALPNKTKNLMMNEAITTVGKIHGKKIKTQDEMVEHLEDLICTAYLLFLEELTLRKDIINHLQITGGLVSYIKQFESKISSVVLTQATLYIKKMSIS